MIRLLIRYIRTTASSSAMCYSCGPSCIDSSFAQLSAPNISRRSRFSFNFHLFVRRKEKRTLTMPVRLLGTPKGQNSPHLTDAHRIAHTYIMVDHQHKFRSLVFSLLTHIVVNLIWRSKLAYRPLPRWASCRCRGPQLYSTFRIFIYSKYVWNMYD